MSFLPQVLNPAQNPRARRNRTVLLIVGGLLVGLLAGWLILRLLPGSHRFNGVVMQSPQPVSDFTLNSVDGPVSLRDFRGQVTVLYFGYTFCPDICPATMAELATARQEIGRRADEVQVILVSVDPARDTPERLAEYVNHFDPSFIGLTGTEEEIAAAAIPLGIFYEKHEGTAATGYLVDHTATVAVVDEDGYLRLVYPFGTSGEEMAADLRYLLRRG